MNDFEALGTFIKYMSENRGRDPHVTKKAFDEGITTIFDSSPDRFVNCHSARAVMDEIGQPYND